MPRAHTLAAAQTIPIRGDVDANVAQHRRLARRAAEARADVVVFPERLCRYATTHAMAVVFSNYGGPTGGLSAGRSAIWSPHGERLAELDGTSMGIAIAVEDDGHWRGSALRID